MARILIVEDDREIRANLARFVRLEGHEALQAANGVDALVLAPQADLVLCDLMLPGDDGFGVLQRLRAAAHTAQLPFILITSNAEEGVIADAVSRGADGYLIKPFDLRALGVRIDEALALGRRRCSPARR